MSQISLPAPDPSVLARRSDIVKQLKKLAPEASMISDQEGRRTFESDALTAYRCLPLAVMLPTTTEEVSKILRFCHDNHVKVVPRGAGTSLCGGALPLEDAVVVCLTRMNKVLSVKRDRSRCPRPGRHHQYRHHPGSRSRRLLLRTGPVEPDRLHSRRQYRHQFRGRPLPEIWRDGQ